MDLNNYAPIIGESFFIAFYLVNCAFFYYITGKNPV